MVKKQTYARAGVDVDVEEDVAEILFASAKKTWKFRYGQIGQIITPFDDFSGIRAIDVGNLPKNTIMSMGFDGVGTKVELAQRMNKHDTIAFDLFAMVCDDAVVRGGEPVLIGSVLDVNTLGTGNSTRIEEVKQLAKGYVEAAKSANVAVINGEIAQLGSTVGGYGDFNYSWNSAVVWFAKKDRMFTGHEIKKGDKLVGLREKGVRSNGLSLIRKIFSDEYGNDWHLKELDGKSLGEHVLEPSTIYTKAVIAMFGGYDKTPKASISGVAHISGGGLPSKVGRMLKPSGLGAVINNPYNPPDIIKLVQELGNVSDREAYRTWNMGQGMVIATKEPDTVMQIAENHDIESKVIGEVTKKQGVEIKYFKD